MRRKVMLLLVLISAAFILGYTVQKPSSAQPAGHSGSVLSPDSPIETSRVNAIVLAARKVAPAVTSISVIQTRYYRSSPFMGDDVFERFFKDFFPPRVYKQEVQSLGSGFIISPEGYVLTNEHVVRGAQEIKVTLPDRREFDARVVGKDEALDVALLKMDSNDLPVAPLGDSDNLIIGEWAIAIGNPFGYLLLDPQPSVTAGVISALYRQIKPTSRQGANYRDMIQTDAAINPGNSGGPLVNAEGEVIGINTFIFTAGGGSEGIGFAIPINAARKVARELIDHGEVRGAWLGLDVQELTPELRERMGERDGVLITEVEEGSSAERSGLRRGDLVIQVNARRIMGLDDWEATNSCVLVGEKVRVTVLRDNEIFEFELTAEATPETSAPRSERFGLTVQSTTPYLRTKFKLRSTKGVVVVEVEAGSDGETAGVEVGDVVLSLNNEEIRDIEDFERAQDRPEKGKLSLLVDRQGTRLYLSFTSMW